MVSEELSSTAKHTSIAAHVRGAGAEGGGIKEEEEGRGGGCVVASVGGVDDDWDGATD